jgi:hypothetical protein
METYLDWTRYNNYGNQYPEVVYWILRGGILNFESRLDTEKEFKYFQTLIYPIMCLVNPLSI